MAVRRTCEGDDQRPCMFLVCSFGAGPMGVGIQQFALNLSTRVCGSKTGHMQAPGKCEPATNDRPSQIGRGSPHIQVIRVCGAWPQHPQLAQQPHGVFRAAGAARFLEGGTFPFDHQ